MGGSNGSWSKVDYPLQLSECFHNMEFMLKLNNTTLI